MGACWLRCSLWILFHAVWEATEEFKVGEWPDVIYVINCCLACCWRREDWETDMEERLVNYAL